MEAFVVTIIYKLTLYFHSTFSDFFCNNRTKKFDRQTAHTHKTLRSEWLI